MATRIIKRIIVGVAVGLTLWCIFQIIEAVGL